MRKEVKLGFAIGGVFLAVMVVYFTAVSGPAKKTATATANDSVATIDVTANSAPPVDANASLAAPAPTELVSANESVKPNTDPFQWDKILETGVPPTLMTSTPAPGETPQNASGAPRDVRPAPAAVANESAAQGTPVVEMVTSPESVAVDQTTVQDITPTVQPTAGARKYTVRAGESFYTIAKAVYDNAHYYPHLQRANPDIKPSALRAGMVINIPDISTVKPMETASRSRVESTQIGEVHGEYRVQPNDNLYRISKRLYGTTKRMQEIYELNKSAIGPDPANVKVGMVLKLPVNQQAAAR